MGDTIDSNLLPGDLSGGAGAELAAKVPLSKADPVNSSMTTNDIMSYTPDGMSDADKKMYAALDSAPTGALPNSTYFPAASHNVRIGGSSTQTLGQRDFFAASTLFPMGVADAREKALQDAAEKRATKIAALQKAIEIPQLDNPIKQGKLNTAFLSWKDKAIDEAKKKYGDNWIHQIKQDPSFQRELSNFQTVAKNENYIVGLVAKTQAESEKTGMSLSPKTIEVMRKVTAGLNNLGKLTNADDPSDIQQDSAYLQASVDVDKLINETAKGIVLTMDPSAIHKTNRGAYDINSYTHTKLLRPEDRDIIATQLLEKSIGKNNLYGFTKEDLSERLKAAVGTQVELKMSEQSNQYPQTKADGSGYSFGGGIGESGNFRYVFGEKNNAEQREAWDKQYGKESLSPYNNDNDNKNKIAFVRTDSQQNTIQPFIDKNGEAIEGRPKGLERIGDRWELIIQTEEKSGSRTIIGKKNIPYEDENKEKIIAEYKDIDKFQADVDREYLGASKTDTEIKDKRTESNKSGSSAVKKTTIKVIRSLVGKKGYENHTEQELIDYYKSQGYTIN